MIQNELKSLIEKYCMGKEPTDAQMDEIMDKTVQVNADFQEVVAFIEEMKSKVQTIMTYTLTLTEISNPMVAMMTARAVLGWDSAQSRDNFANLPMVVKTTTSQEEASEIYEKLSHGGMVIEPNAVEGTDDSDDENSTENAVDNTLEDAMESPFKNLVPPIPPTPPAPPVVSSYDVVLKSKGPNLIRVIQLLKKMFGLDLGQAKSLVDNAPSVIKNAAPKAEAESIKAQFEAIGASVELKNN